MSAKTPWEFAGLDQLTYSKLKWPEMRKILIRFRGLRIADTCADCGHRLDLMAERRRDQLLAPALRNHPYGRLFNAWFQYNAETFTIKNNTGGSL